MATPEETAQRMLAAFQKLNDRTIELQREVEVLTQERDNALLERDRWEGLYHSLHESLTDPHGGVNPNA